MPQLVQVDLADIDPVDPDRARGDVVEPADHRDQRGLPRPRGADDSGGLTRPRCQRNPLQHRPVGALVTEGGIVEHDLPGNARQRDRLGRTDHRGMGVEHLGDAFGAHRRARNDHQDERGHQHRHQDLHEVGQERDQ